LVEKIFKKRSKSSTVVVARINSLSSVGNVVAFLRHSPRSMSRRKGTARPLVPGDQETARKLLA
jgi:hypothetical protein